MRRAILASIPLLALAAAALADVDPAYQAQVAADWLTQVRRGTGKMTTALDAQGGCDGVKNGRWGFHTALQAGAWWHVNLGAEYPLDRVVIYNRCDGVQDRSANLHLLLSNDAREWRDVYQHNGTTFYGFTDGKPLEVPLGGAVARWVRIALPGDVPLHLDEVEVYGTTDPATNIALWKPADQSTTCEWSVAKFAPGAVPGELVRVLAERGERLADDLAAAGVDAAPERGEIAAARTVLDGGGDPAALHARVREATRSAALKNPLLSFDSILFAKAAASSYSHMSDQYYGWWSRPGGGIYVLSGWKEGHPSLRCLTEGMPEGSFLRPELSYDATKVLFAYARYHQDVSGLADKVRKENLPEDAFYHLYEVGIDGSGLRRLSSGKYDDFDARYLPSGDIVFLSTRRGQAVQCGVESAMATLLGDLPNSYVRCGGDAYRPVAVYTLHVMDPEGKRVRAISPFENFEWTPSVADDGRILFARWDYIDRTPMPFISLWSVHPDGTMPQIVYKNYTTVPHCVFEARQVPGSRKIVFTGSAHHSVTGGSLALLDPAVGVDGSAPLTRLTPEVCFPEVEGWPLTYYSSPYPLSDSYFLTSWSDQPLAGQGGVNAANALGIYLSDAFGNLDLIYRDQAISSQWPIPVRPRPIPPVLSTSIAASPPIDGRLLLQNVHDGLGDSVTAPIAALRIVGVPAKVQPEMNNPGMGLTHDDPGKFVIGTAPVESDGSAYLRVPAGVGFFVQALDDRGVAVQTMRGLTSVQPGQTLTCVGCHDPRTSAPPNASPKASGRAASRLRPGPSGTWPLRYEELVQPVLDRSCASCHRSDGPDPAAARVDLAAASASYNALVDYGRPSLREHVMARYNEGRSIPGQGAAATSPIAALIRKGHHDVTPTPEDWERLDTWLDLYGQWRGAFSAEQEQLLVTLRTELAEMLEE
jgi:hypothetical protein